MSEQSESEKYTKAIKKANGVMGLVWHTLSFVIVNAFLLVLVYLGRREFFTFLIGFAGWGLGLAIHAGSTFFNVGFKDKITKHFLEK